MIFISKCLELLQVLPHTIIFRFGISMSFSDIMKIGIMVYERVKYTSFSEVLFKKFENVVFLVCPQYPSY